MDNLLIQNLLLAIPPVALVLWTLVKWRARRLQARIQPEAIQNKAPKRNPGKLKLVYKLSIGILLFYCSIGYLDQFGWPCQNQICTPVDILFNSVSRERSYSAPLAAREYQASDQSATPLHGLHLLGTDINGRDTLYLIAKSTGTIIKLVAGSMLISFPLGLLLGLLSGYAGGWIDDAIQWLYNTIASIPWLLFMIAFLIVFGRDLLWICVAFGLTTWIELARLIRAETLKIKELNYIKAAQSSGIPRWRILIRHILPNVSHISSVHFSLTASSIILAESVLTFIGIGVDPGTISFGSMLVDAQLELMRSPPIWWIFVGVALLGIMPLVLSLNLVADIRKSE